MERHSGNAAVWYARLDIEGGQKKMLDEPWTQQEVVRSVVGRGSGVEEWSGLFEGVWSKGEKGVVVGMRSWDGGERDVVFMVCG